MNRTPFDPWDWLGVHCGGFHSHIDLDIIEFLESIQDVTASGDGEYPYRALICTLLCNTDAFEFDGDPTQLRFVGDDTFGSLQDLIDAWEHWYGEHYR